MMEYTILKYAPDYWVQSTQKSGEYQVYSGTNEYRTIESEVSKALLNPRSIEKIIRIQNIHDLGQLLIREQFLIAKEPFSDFYRERRFITIGSAFYRVALEHNLDYRRCNMSELSFKRKLCCYNDNILVAVQVVTKYPDSDEILPKNSLEYFIDYVIFFN